MSKLYILFKYSNNTVETKEFSLVLLLNMNITNTFFLIASFLSMLSNSWPSSKLNNYITRKQMYKIQINVDA